MFSDWLEVTVIGYNHIHMELFNNDIYLNYTIHIYNIVVKISLWYFNPIIQSNIWLCQIKQITNSHKLTELIQFQGSI